MKLRSYQKDGVAFLLSTGGRSLLADDMGTGKTLQALCAAKVLKRLGYVDKVLIVCPQSLMTNWSEEHLKFFKSTPYVHHGNKRSVERFMAEDTVITSYATFKRDCDKFKHQLDHRGGIKKVFITKKLMVIMDEAHKCKSVASDNFKLFQALQDKYRILITGTPVDNKPEDAYGVLKTTDKDFMSYATFKDIFCKTQEKTVGRWGNMKRSDIVGYKEMDLLHKILNKYMIRRTKAEVMKDLPANSHVDFYYTPDSKTLSNLEKLWKETDNERRKLTRYNQCFQVLDGLYKGEFIWNNKNEALMELINSNPDRLVVWFYRSKEVLHGIKARLQSKNTVGYDKRAVLIHTGDESQKQKDEALKAWRETPGAILLATMQSAGVGLNLVEGNYQIFYDHSTKASENDQATDRLHRGGQTKPVTTVHMIGKGTAEEGLMYLVSGKRKYANAIMHGEGMKELNSIVLRLSL